ncbi:MAG: ABC transporter ATP-binding protein [Calditrichaeota bacterium]|nr:MAG: ABC transporter ATP-binding protein [Calditrichota bacterium]NOG44656.1 ABC transporter ATP-binding protein [Calditrichota bacterium]
MNFAIKTHSISKSFDTFKAVDSVNLQVPNGSIYGYLGANGSGKTTTIRMLLNLLKVDSGSIEILGNPLPKSFVKIAPKIGVVPGEIKMYEELTGVQTLDYFQGFLPGKPVLRSQLTNDFKLTEVDLSKKVRYYSQGMKQKLLLIQAMQHDPQLLILDEPSERLDPLIQNILYDYIMDFQSRKKTVFFSSHNLPEVEKICDHIGIIKDGRLLVQDKISDLKEKLPRVVKITFKEKINFADFNTNSFKVIESFDKTLQLKIQGSMQPLMQLLKKYDVNDLEIPESSLESFFMKYYLESN